MKDVHYGVASQTNWSCARQSPEEFAEWWAFIQEGIDTGKRDDGDEKWDVAPVVREMSAPAANPTGSDTPASGQPSNMNRSVRTGIVRGPATNPTGSVGPSSGQPSNMDTSAARYIPRPRRRPARQGRSATSNRPRVGPARIGRTRLLVGAHRGQRQRDRRHPAPAGAAGARRRPGDDRRHRRAGARSPRPSCAAAATTCWR